MTVQPPLSSRVKQIIEVDGLRFRDLDGDGQLTPFEDWRLSPAERAADLVSRMSPEEKIGLMVITSRPMGISQRNPEFTSHDGVLDEQHLPIKVDPHTSAGLPFEGTTEMISGLHIRRFIMREEPTGSRIASWLNAMNEVAESSRWGIPVLVAANSKNEAGGFKMGGTDEDQPFTQWPGTLGLAATGSLEVIESFAAHSRAEWRATGLRKGYMYMADVLTDPRWYRGQGTLGEDPEFVSRAIAALVRGFQGEDGPGADGVALTTKHFPGGGARENGTDPHYAEGRFNIYPTPGSLEEYHLPPFQAAIEAGTSAVMPYYAIPSKEKSSTPQGRLTDFEQVGFAFNREVLNLLREMGHRGYINSDSGVLSKMAWGVEELTTAERVGRAVMAGTDLFADTNDVASVREAFVRGLFTQERLDEAAALLLEELFALGLFENPYADPEEADRVVQNAEARAAAEDAHRRSVVLAKNHGELLPLREESLQGTRVYLERFAPQVTVRQLDALRRRIARAHPEVSFTTDYRDADTALLLLQPVIGSYFEYVGIGDLSIDDHSQVDIEKVRDIRAHVDTLVIGLNTKFPWLLDSIEPLADALLMGFDTDDAIMVEAIFGGFSPTGTLPITFPIDADAIAVDEQGRCASPNDVPGFAKEQHMDGRPYVYVDADGNRYRLGHGLTYDP
ncbi:beta-glucosidase-like glycosyl hydrolase [Brachybacterium faecium DSM 4810]|uniref:beta-glucosidase n=1 Tax=Brachybacterium faecium (strain ATCC 43885 / DSM 4810 / JCM 11609 / LMG 19847 / NBRC 14762 / NCIMB 9860 / 6-10) TaxID=446465 RepID=C7ME28_BRAFD|nr:glycoside hydrolase family 3 N-terminal domain-containing protein [Brachybacterium faecium]ACU85835.1 beta-glucosidase-like glycosyl hydrolase [Brachybacterium faecium DSM 4810]HJG52041.1 glycoside hydrolase family 3 protein [Brachybacterium faecium]